MDGKTAFLYNLITAAASPWLLPLIIIPSVIVLEDPTIVLVGILASQHVVSLFVGMLLLVIGIGIGDSLAYTIGKLAKRHKLARRIAEHERVEMFQRFLNERSTQTIFTVRFMPGFRFSMYIACGLLEVPYQRFLPVSIASAIVWTTLLAIPSFIFGTYTLHTLGYWRWPLLATVLIIFIFVWRHHWKKFFKEELKQNTAA